MGQHEVASYILESENEVSKGELIRYFDTHKRSTEASINKLIRKGYLVKTQTNKLQWNPEVDPGKIENLRPPSLDDLDF